MHQSRLAQLTDEDLQRIRYHALTSKLGPDKPAQAKCSCCGLDVIEEEISVCCKVEEFAHIGLLYPMYFLFIRYMAAYLILASVFSFVNIRLNRQGNSCEDGSGISCHTSITNLISQLDNQDLFQLQTVNNYLFIGASILFLQIMTSLLKKKCKKMRDNQRNECDYGVVLKDVKSNKPIEILNQIKFLEDAYWKKTGRRNVIISFVMLTNMRAYSENQEKILTQSQIQSYDGSLEQKLEISQSIHGRQSGIQSTNLLSSRQSEVPTFSGKVIVFFMYPVKPSQFSQIELEHLTDSSDVIWQNIGLKRQEDKNLWMLVGTGFLMVLAFLIILLLKLWIKNLTQGQHFITTTVLNLVVATVVAIFNSIEGIVIRMCARRQLYGTHSKFFRIVARRLSYVFFINMVMTTYFSNLVVYMWNDETDKVLPLDYSGLVTDFFFLFLTNTYISSIFNYFDIFYGRKLYQRYKLVKHRNRQGFSDEELNFIFEGHPVDMGLRYGNVMKTLFFTAFISPFVPLGTFFSLLGLAICYWVDKYLLLRRYVSRYELSPHFAKQMVKIKIMQTEFAKFYVVLYSFSNVLLQLIPINKDDQIQPIGNSSIFISTGVFIGTMIYKYGMTWFQQTLFGKKFGRDFDVNHSYAFAKQRFRNRYQDKLQVIDVEQLIKGTRQSRQNIQSLVEMDPKLVHSVRVSTIQRVIEEYP